MNARSRSYEVLVVVGTDKHPFDRLVRWVDSWISARGDASITCLVQYGASHPPQAVEGMAFVDHDDLADLMRRCSVIVTHGGPSTISEARRFGHRPLVVPRRATLGEHVDDHQVWFTSRLSKADLIDIVDSPAQLAEAIESRLRRQVAATPQSTCGSGAAALAFGDVVDEVLQRRH